MVHWATAGLALLLLGMQSVRYIDCCCGAFCTRPGQVCQDCDHETGKAKAGG